MAMPNPNPKPNDPECTCDAPTFGSVTDSRRADSPMIDLDGKRIAWIRRRRFCGNCGARFTTYELRRDGVEALRDALLAARVLADAIDELLRKRFDQDALRKTMGAMRAVRFAGERDAD